MSGNSDVLRIKKAKSFGGEISAQISEHLFEFLDAPILRVASEDLPIAYSSTLEEKILVQTNWIKDAINKTINY